MEHTLTLYIPIPILTTRAVLKMTSLESFVCTSKLQFDFPYYWMLSLFKATYVSKGSDLIT